MRVPLNKENPRFCQRRILRFIALTVTKEYERPHVGRFSLPLPQFGREGDDGFQAIATHSGWIGCASEDETRLNGSLKENPGSADFFYKPIVDGFLERETKVF